MNRFPGPAITVLSFLLLAPLATAWAQEADILLIRPDRFSLPGGEIVLPSRDPFSWSAEQMARFRAADRKKRAEIFSGISLSGIIWDRKKPLAIINGILLERGGRINGVTIKKIRKDSVVLEKYGTSYTLEFEPQIVGLKPGK